MYVFKGFDSCVHVRLNIKTTNHNRVMSDDGIFHESPILGHWMVYNHWVY